MANEKEKKAEDQIKDLDDLEVTEVDDENLEKVSGGGNFNCGCGPSFDPS